MIDAVFVNGTVGAGKTTLAEEVSRQEGAAGVVHALIDVDALRRVHPAPADDPFQHRLELANLRDVARNSRDAGARRLVLAGVIEERGEVPRYAEALGVAGLLVVRLVVRPGLAAERLRRRHADMPEELEWHLRRSPELAAALEAADLDDLVLDSSDTAPAALARRVRKAAGWS